MRLAAGSSEPHPPERPRGLRPVARGARESRDRGWQTSTRGRRRSSMMPASASLPEAYDGTRCSALPSCARSSHCTLSMARLLWRGAGTGFRSQTQCNRTNSGRIGLASRVSKPSRYLPFPRALLLAHRERFLMDGCVSFRGTAATTSSVAFSEPSAFAHRRVVHRRSNCPLSRA